MHSCNWRNRSRRWLWLAAALGTDCTGAIEGEHAVQGAWGAAAGSSAPLAGRRATPTAPASKGGDPIETSVPSSALPRLSHRQWAISVKDLLQLDTAPVVSAFASDPPAATGFDNNGGRLEVSQGLWTDYQAASEQLAEQVAKDPVQLTKLLPAGSPSSGDARAQAFIAGLGERAFRRPLTSAEAGVYLALWKRGPSLISGRDEWSAGAQITIQALLQDPNFLYRVEGPGSPDNQGVTVLSDYEIAGRMSYMLWDSLPDAALLSAAKSGELHTPEQLARHARRMLGDARATDKLEEFHRQLLELRNYDTLRVQALPAGLGAALRGETERFVRDVLIEQNGSFDRLLTASYSFVNQDLAMLYGLTGTFGTELVRAELDPKQRAGLLTQPGFLIYRSGDTAPILRGVYINMKFLCADLPPPPVFTPPKLTGTTRRERIDSITGLGTCGEGCHARMINPAGYPLEVFDDLGRFRSQDNGRPVDAVASYTFNDGTHADYTGPIEWSRALAQSRQAHECYVRHWLEFGFGRAYAAGDRALVQRVADSSLTQRASVKELLVQLVQSPSFRSLKQEAP
jgi:hypothetical protein